MRIGPRQEDQIARRINLINKFHVSGIYKTLVKWFLVWVTNGHVGRWLMVLRVCMVDIDLENEIHSFMRMSLCSVCMFFVRLGHHGG